MNPTGRYAHMFEGKVRKGSLSKTTEILLKEEIKIALRIRRKEKILIIFPPLSLPNISV
jgi:hypothetical protein